MKTISVLNISTSAISVIQIISNFDLTHTNSKVSDMNTLVDSLLLIWLMVKLNVHTGPLHLVAEEIISLSAAFWLEGNLSVRPKSDAVFFRPVGHAAIFRLKMVTEVKFLLRNSHSQSYHAVY